jgi:hypothetical protein
MTLAQRIYGRGAQRFDLCTIKQQASIKQIAEQAGVKLNRAGSEWKGLCPFHFERTPSFTIYKDDQRWHCHGCGKGGDALDFVQQWRGVDLPGAIALIAPDAQPATELCLAPVSAAPAAQHAVFMGPGQRIVATYEFFDASRALAYRKHRIEPGVERDKDFRYDHPDGSGGWIAGQGTARVPYRLPDILALPDEPLFMAEGEAKADRLASWGYLATSHKDWRPEFAEHVAGRCVVILPDADDTGDRLASRTAVMVKEAGGQALVLKLPGLPPKGDILDWGGSKDDLAALVSMTLRTAANDEDGQRQVIAATPFAWPSPEKIPPRRWLFGYWLLRGEVTAVIAPGGVGKSTFTTGVSLSLASGIDFLGKALPEGACSTWLWNLEDDQAELDRQVTACGLLHGVGPTECGNRLYVDSGLNMQLCTAIEDGHGFKLIEPVYEAVKAEIETRHIDALIIDPFVSSHEVPENDNQKIDKVAKRWKRLASETGCAIVLVHHTKKMGGREVRAEDSRGAVALINAARSTLVLNPMSKEEAEGFGITDRSEQRRLVRVDDDKPNRAPPESAWWFRKESVDLGNGDGLTPGDNVGAAMPWSPPDPFDGLCARDLYKVQCAIDQDDYGDAVTASDWAGRAVAQALGLNLETDKARIKSLLRTWKGTGALKVEHRDLPQKGRKKPFVVVGSWVDPSTLPTLQTGVG